MRKILAIMLALAMVLALASTAYASTIPAGSITITAQPVDYVSALAGIAKPTSAAHYENERATVTIMAGALILAALVWRKKRKVY